MVDLTEPTELARAAPPPSLSLQQIGGGLLEPGRSWSGSTITFSIPDASATWTGYPAGSEPLAPNHFTALTATQAARFADAIMAWDELIAPQIVQVDDATPGQIRVGFSNISDLSTAWGYAYYPPTNGGAGTPRMGDIWISD